MQQESEQIEAVSRRADLELTAVAQTAALEQFRVRFLGANGEIKRLLNLLSNVPRDQKSRLAGMINAVRNQVSSAFEAKKRTLNSSPNPIR
jgi:phenylalanyl-tRNA synthetase alpha subunit